MSTAAAEEFITFYNTMRASLTENNIPDNMNLLEKNAQVFLQSPGMKLVTPATDINGRLVVGLYPSSKWYRRLETDQVALGHLHSQKIMVGKFDPISNDDPTGLVTFIDYAKNNDSEGLVLFLYTARYKFVGDQMMVRRQENPYWEYVLTDQEKTNQINRIDHLTIDPLYKIPSTSTCYKTCISNYCLLCRAFYKITNMKASESLSAFFAPIGNFNEEKFKSDAYDHATTTPDKRLTSWKELGDESLPVMVCVILGYLSDVYRGVYLPFNHDFLDTVLEYHKSRIEENIRAEVESKLVSRFLEFAGHDPKTKPVTVDTVNIVLRSIHEVMDYVPLWELRIIVEKMKQVPPRVEKRTREESPTGASTSVPPEPVNNSQAVVTDVPTGPTGPTEPTVQTEPIKLRRSERNRNKKTGGFAGIDTSFLFN